MKEHYKVDSSIVGDLLVGELPYWQVGVCKIELREYEQDKDEIMIRGENGHPIGEVELDEWRPSQIEEDEEVLDLKVLAEQVNEIIEDEHSEL